MALRPADILAFTARPSSRLGQGAASVHQGLAGLREGIGDIRAKQQHKTYEAQVAEQERHNVQLEAQARAKQAEAHRSAMASEEHKALKRRDAQMKTKMAFWEAAGDQAGNPGMHDAIMELSNQLDMPDGAGPAPPLGPPGSSMGMATSGPPVEAPVGFPGRDAPFETPGATTSTLDGRMFINELPMGAPMPMPQPSGEPEAAMPAPTPPLPPSSDPLALGAQDVVGVADKAFAADDRSIHPPAPIMIGGQIVGYSDAVGTRQRATRAFDAAIESYAGAHDVVIGDEEKSELFRAFSAIRSNQGLGTPESKAKMQIDMLEKFVASKYAEQRTERMATAQERSAARAGRKDIEATEKLDRSKRDEAWKRLDTAAKNKKVYTYVDAYSQVSDWIGDLKATKTLPPGERGSIIASVAYNLAHSNDPGAKLTDRDVKFSQGDLTWFDTIANELKGGLEGELVEARYNSMMHKVKLKAKQLDERTLTTYKALKKQSSRLFQGPSAAGADQWFSLHFGEFPFFNESGGGPSKKAPARPRSAVSGDVDAEIDRLLEK